MSGGTSPELQVVTSSLRKVARIWDQEAEAIGTVPGKVQSLRLDRFDAGVFQLIVAPYDSVVNAVAERTGEGQHQMRDIASALCQNADNYDTAEAQNVRAVGQVGR